MPLVAGVSFRRVGKVYYFDPGELPLHEGDFVIAETARGVEFGEVVLEPRHVTEAELVAPLKKIVRQATGDDLEREAANREREAHAYQVCDRKIGEHNLPMKLLEAEYAFDGSQVTFSFSADGRIDFRELVKDVAGVLKTKVQLHQIGVRDEAKLIGGYGTCGRPLCCSTFLSAFDPISMKMAKDQSLFLNPAKFSGCCGKLMCCLRYEHEFYKESQKCLPSVGAILQLEQGRAKVVDVNFISGTITVQTEEDVQIHIPASSIDMHGMCRRHGIGCTMSESHCEPIRIDPHACAVVASEVDEAEADEEPHVLDVDAPDYVIPDDYPRARTDAGPSVDSAPAGAANVNAKPSKDRPKGQGDRGNGRNANASPGQGGRRRPWRRKKPMGSNDSGDQSAPQSGGGEQK
jgi:cell fate regulator YaaT (PSP1 superfamily)